MKIISGILNGQVLQRRGSDGASVRIEGTSVESGPVMATIFASGKVIKGWNKKNVGNAVRGKFSVGLSGIPTGGPYRLHLSIGQESVEIPTFFVGDVWVLAGQSNMEGVGDISGAAKPHPLIRAFSMRREWRQATDPLHVLAESPDICHNGGTQISPEEAEKRRKLTVKGVGTGIFFAREMLKRSNVPQGLIAVAHGGTSMEQWSPERKKLQGESLYWSMLESVRMTGQSVSGVLWYQGESDGWDAMAPLYTGRMQKLVAASRRDLGQAKLPWIIVQLARFFSGEPNFPYWNSIQEQQRLLPAKIKNFETVPAIDLPMDDFIHVGSAGFATLGQRMARVADRMVYGNKKEKRPPQLRKIVHRVTKQKPPVYVSHTIEVVYDNVEGELRSTGEADGFALVRPDGKVLPTIYKTVLAGNKVVLHAQGGVPKDARLSYGHGYYPHCNITDERGFVLPVFGPCEIDRSHMDGFLPFVVQWKVTGVVAAAQALNEISCPDVDQFNPEIKTYGENGFASGMEGFINMHAAWMNQKGHAYFQAKLTLTESMKLEALVGYDGPFRLWVDGKTVFTDMKGINPCVPDKGKKAIQLDKGSHEIVVGMDLACGKAWGFFLRFKRLDVSPAKIKTGKFVKPSYSV
jgi:sialate O-acetylesterase